MRCRSLFALLLAILTVLAVIPAHAYQFGGPKKTVEQILALPAADFQFGVSEYTRDAISKNDKSALPGLWKLYEKAVEERPLARFASALAAITEAIGNLGSMEDYQRLLPGYDAERKDYERFIVYLIPLRNILARQEIEYLPQTPLAPLPVPEDLQLPKQLQGAAPGLQDAWRKYASLQAAFRAIRSSQTKTANALNPQGITALYAEIGAFLHSRSAGSAAMSGYQWSGMCGTFSESLYRPKYLGMFLALLSEKRYHEALGALMAFEEEDGRSIGGGSNAEDFQWKRRFITFCGYDWEELYAGAASGQLAGPHFVHYLAAFGSDKSAGYIADLLEANGSDDRAKVACIGAVARMIGNTARSGLFVDELARLEPPVSADMQDKLVNLIAAQARPDASKNLAEACVRALSGLDRPEAMDALKLFVGSPYNSVRAQADKALRTLGVQVEVAPPSGPVRFRFLDHGRPLSGVRVDVELYYNASEFSGTMTDRTTDANGVINLDYDYFVDPKRGVAGVSLGLRLYARDAQLHPQEPVLYIWQPVPTNLDAVTDENVDFAKLTVNFGFANPDGLKWSLKLNNQQGPKSISYMNAPVLSKEIPAGRQIVFEKVGRGSYKLEVMPAKGYKPLVSRIVEMTGEDQTVDLSE